MIQDIAPHIYDITYKHLSPCDDDTMLIYDNGRVFCKNEGDTLSFPTVSELEKSIPDVKVRAKFLFCIDGKGYFELYGTLPPEADGYAYLPKGQIRGLSPSWLSFAAITGFQIHSWYESNRFCGFCGKKMKPKGDERAMICEGCGRIKYPQICPSVIVAVTNGEKILLTKYAASHSTHRRFALVAGYTEIGESFEDTVRREVMEEVGLKVKNIKYFKSQPWSFSDSLLAGFFCEVDGKEDVTLDKNELSEAVWFERDDIPEESADPSVSLTGTMIWSFKNRMC